MKHVNEGWQIHDGGAMPCRGEDMVQVQIEFKQSWLDKLRGNPVVTTYLIGCAYVFTWKRVHAWRSLVHLKAENEAKYVKPKLVKG